MNTLTSHEVESVLTICLLAAFSDGEKSDTERAQIRRIADTFPDADLNIPALCQRVLMAPPALPHVCEVLSSSGAKKLAYELAVCVIEADNVRPEGERAFLAELRAALGLAAMDAQPIEAEVATLAMVPVPDAPAPADAASSDAMILKYAIFAGALELLPQNLATLAVVPLQTKMVYRIAKQQGIEPDRRTVAELLATVGLGLASQVFEGFLRKMSRQIGQKVGGKTGGKIADAAAGSATAFAATYALGHLARAYYSGGRSMSADALKSRFTSLTETGKQLAAQHLPQITAQGESLARADIGTLMKAAP
jgi:uncharacterized protein (DUF697 family)